MRRLFSALLLCGSAGIAGAQSVIESQVWRQGTSFLPYSRTAVAIMGEITLTERTDADGGPLQMRFGTGKTVNLIPEGLFWRRWDFANDGKQTGEVFRLEEDPGPLVNGNRLCGGHAEGALYAVFFEQEMFAGPRALGLAIFDGASPPFDIGNPEPCGTYTFDIPGAWSKSAP